MANSFCRYLSNGYTFAQHNNSLVMRPCCLFDHSIEFDKNFLKNRQEKFSSINQWTPHCKECQLKEETGQHSLRQASFDWIPDDAEDMQAISIDISLDMTCNAACVICDDKASSLWTKENQKLKGIPVFVEDKSQSIHRHINEIKSSLALDRVRYVKFWGGEPMFTDTHVRFLECLPNLSEVTVHYTTNGSMFPNDRVLELWNKCKTVIYASSIDGVDDQFNYVRWPLSWEKVSRNLIRIKNAAMHNLMFRVEFTANFLNTYYFDRLEDWVKNNLEYNMFGDKTEINIHHCVRNVFQLSNMPNEIRELIKAKYDPQHTIHRLVDQINQKHSLDEWQKFVDIWDARRKLRWQDCFPDLTEYLGK